MAARRMTPALRAVQATAWAMLPEKLEAIVAFLEFRAAGGTRTADERRAIAAVNRPPSVTQGKIAVLPVFGVLAPRMDMMMEISGGTSTETLSKQFTALVNDTSVAAIVLNVDSPGGAVDGIPELAATIAAARGMKPIIAVANTMAASAAYWIASAADEIVATPSATVGSIGVFTVHVDLSGADAQEGVTRTLVSAGRYKTEGNPYEPLSADARAAMQQMVDQYYGMFVRAVAQHRGVTPERVVSGYGEGRVLLAESAKAAGMIDRIETLDQTLARLSAGGQRATLRIGADAPPRSIGARDATAIERLAAVAAALPVTPGTVTTTISAGVAMPGAMLSLADDGAGAAASADARPETSPAPQAKEHTMAKHDDATAAQNGAAPEPDFRAVLKAERERAREIRALCREHDVSAEQMQTMIDDELSVPEAKAAIFDLKAQERARTPRITVGADREAERGFTTFGEQMVAIVQAGLPAGRVDPRLAAINHRMLAGSPSGMNESVGAEGGFFIQPELLPGVLDPVYTDDPILSRVTRIPIGATSNGIKYNVVDETSRATGSRWGGIQMYWAAEADQYTASKPKLRQMELSLKKLIGLAYLTEEQMVDAPAAQALLTRAFQSETSFFIGDGIFRGKGGGQMLGFLNSKALVTTPIEGGQTIANSNQYIAKNVAKMLASVPASLWGQTIILYNQEMLGTLVTATVGTGGSAVPVFLGANGISGKPYDTILGRPAFASELCEQEGTVGDFVIVAPSEYHLADKGGPQQATSIHVRFLYDEQALKITYRVDGAPVWKQAVTPYKGAVSRSPFVALAARA